MTIQDWIDEAEDCRQGGQPTFEDLALRTAAFLATVPDIAEGRALQLAKAAAAAAAPR